MKDNYKAITHDIFQKLIVFSVFLVPLFFWPQHELRLMKFICLQTICTILLVLSFLFTPKRTIDNYYPALFMILGFANLFTHGMSDFVNVGLSFILIAVTGIYVISNHLSEEYVSVIKKSIVLMCLINCALYLTQVCHLELIFSAGGDNVSHQRPCGFMCYPANFALICGISIFLAWDWRKWLCIPIALCLCLSREFSVIGGLAAALSIPYFMKFRWIYLIFGVLAGLAAWHWWPQIESKAALRVKYLLPVFQNVWARPIDGWGVGMINRLPESFWGFNRGNWSELHCEPLDLLFCMGLTGFALGCGWVWHSIKNMQMIYKQIFTVIGIMACFHSPLHFSDTLWICVVLLSLMEVEKYEFAAAD